MPDLPNDVFQPKPGPKRVLRRWRLTEPDDGYGNPESLVQSGIIQQGELDGDNLIPAGQEFETVEYEECQLSHGSEQEIGTSGEPKCRDIAFSLCDVLD
jgi:hypothetical protein